MKRTLALFLPLLAPALLHAHPGGGHVHGLEHGFAHPIGGWDHLLAMVAVGLWARQLGGRAVWAVPATFVGIMVGGGILGMSGVEFGFVEQGIVGSVLILGLLIAAAWRLPLGASVPLVALFAFCHGHAHGTEMPGDASGLAYAAGFVAATALLHACGIGLGMLLHRLSQPVLIRVAGAACAVCGLVLILQ
jgi:urease accessory protein